MDQTVFFLSLNMITNIRACQKTDGLKKTLTMSLLWYMDKLGPFCFITIIHNLWFVCNWINQCR